MEHGIILGNRKWQVDIDDPHRSQFSVPYAISRGETAAHYWVNLSEYYLIPNVVCYNSVSVLADIFQTITLEQLMGISKRIRLFNMQEYKRLTTKWRNTLS